MGSYNKCYRMRGLDSIIRFPIFRKSAFRYEKTADECQIMKYIDQHTTIPIPKLMASKLEGCDFDIGPYMVTEFVDGSRLSDFLKASSDAAAAITLQPDIDTALLSKVYRNIIPIILELSKSRFSHIGAVGKTESGE